MNRLLFTPLVFLLCLASGTSAADFPQRPVTVVVGFGVGGSADRMARMMAPFLAEQLGQPVQVVNKKGAGTLLAANYVLSRPADGYNLFASTFSPYLLNTILKGEADYAVDDFAYLNFQWFDEDLFAVNRDTHYQSLEQLLQAIRQHPQTVTAAVVKGSAGHLMARLLLEVNGIPQRNLNLVTYNSGGQARAAVAGGVVDFIVISATGSESIREYLRPLAVVSDQPSVSWGVPTLNQALAPLGVSAPVLPGSLRGFAVDQTLLQQHPERAVIWVEALREALENPELRNLLQQADIGYRWIGPEEADRLMRDNLAIFRHYAYLLQVE